MWFCLSLTKSIVDLARQDKTDGVQAFARRLGVLKGEGLARQPAMQKGYLACP